MGIDLSALERSGWLKKDVATKSFILFKQFGREQVSIKVECEICSQITIVVEAESQFSGLAQKKLGPFSSESEAERLIYSECDEAEKKYSHPPQKFRPKSISNTWTPD